jgi:phosphoribosyl-ATP pyrophosphohydrolase
MQVNEYCSIHVLVNYSVTATNSDYLYHVQVVLDSQHIKQEAVFCMLYFLLYVLHV